MRRLVEARPPVDMDLVASIARAVRVDTFAAKGRGFLVSPLSADEYANRIANGYTIHLLMQGDSPVGMVSGIRSENLTRPDRPTSTLPAVHAFIRDYCQREAIAHYFVLAQLAVLPDHQNHGHGAAFLHLLLKDVARPVFIDVLERPLENPRLRWWRAQGFTRIGDVPEVLPADRPVFGSRELTWGIYMHTGMSFPE